VGVAFWRLFMTARSYPNPIREAKADLGPVCLVVGGAGFLGQALTRALLERGHRVRVLDRTPLPAGGRAEQHLADIRDLGAVREATSGVSTVFHTAAVINLLGVYDRATRAEVFGINYDGTRNVIQACVDAGVPRLVHTSTNSVCFDPDPVVNGDESKPYATRFIDLYAESKVEAERAVPWV
jgi:3beta-hydroxy-delta5-steroid dehydrogenase/steroid delta-isomerase